MTSYAALFFRLAIGMIASSSAFSQVASPNQFPLAAIKYFGSTAGALYTATTEPPTSGSQSRLDTIARAAYREMQVSKAAASLTTATADFATAGLALSTIDPEPVSHTVIAVSSYAIQQGAQFASGKIMEQAEEHVKQMLATRLSQSGLSPEELSAMPKQQLLDLSMDMKTGGKSIRELFKDSPAILDYTNAVMDDFKQNVSVASLLEAKKNSASMDELISQVKSDSTAFLKFRDATAGRFDKVDSALSDLSETAMQTNADLVLLRKETEKNGAAIGSLLQVSFQEWSPGQKLAALHNGMFPDMPQSERDATEKALNSQIKLQKAVTNLSALSQDLGNVSTIASALHVDPSIVSTINKGQVVVAGVMQFATGNYLGAIASVTGLLGAGQPDPIGAQFTALYGYLDQQFAKVNERLGNIEALQLQTIEQLKSISNELISIESQLSEVNRNILLNGDMLRILVAQKWAPCQAFITNSLHGTLRAEGPEDIYAIADDPLAQRQLDNCYWTYTTEFFDSFFAKGALRGGELDSRVFSDAGTLAAKKAPDFAAAVYNAREMSFDYTLARQYFLVADPISQSTPVSTLLKLAGPAATVAAAANRDIYIRDTANAAKPAQCGDGSPPIDRSLWRLICGSKRGVTPSADDWSRIINETAIGFQSAQIVNIGIALSGLVNLTRTTRDGHLNFADKKELLLFETLGPSRQLTEGAKEGKADAIALRSLALAQNFVIQQSLAYGDLLAKEVFETLYDSSSPNNLATIAAAKAPPSSAASRALAVMRSNPVVARNVMMLAARRALSTANGRPEITFYTRALIDYMAVGPCTNEPYRQRRLKALLPNWRFGYRKSGQEKTPDIYKDCKLASERKEELSGLTVEFDDFYVKAPAPATVLAGAFEQPFSLAFAISLRDKALDQIIRLRFGDFIDDPQSAADLLKSGCLMGQCTLER